MRFLGRKQELLALEKMYQKDTFQMLVLYGRRRIGKTTLLNRFSMNKDPLFYTGIESKDNENLREFGHSVFLHFDSDASAEFRTFSDVCAYLTSCIKKTDPKKRHLIILDEYPYMAESAPELSSVLQREIDREWKNLNIMLVLCGSSITFMEENVLGEKSPLFGRRTGQMDLLPFDYLTSAEFTENYSPEEKAIVYGITGGIPKYLAETDPALSLKENMINTFFSPSGYFYEEPKNLLRQEFRDVPLYFAILNAMGSGCTQMSEIAAKTGFDTAKTAQAIKRLERVRIIAKEVPILNEKNKKLTQYVLRDGMFRFWFRFVTKGTAAIEHGFGRTYYEQMVEPYLHEYMGSVFENICQEYTFRQGIIGAYGKCMTRIGKWRGVDPVNKCPSDIDVVAVNDVEKAAVIGECKFKNEPFGKAEYEKLLDRARLLAPFKVEHFLIFSLNGTAKWVSEQNDPGVETVTMEQLYQNSEIL